MRMLPYLLILTVALLAGAEPGQPGDPTKDLGKVAQDVVVNSNEKSLGVVRAFAAKKGLALREVGVGTVRFLWIGGAKHADADDMLARAGQTLTGLELWTGRQETFIPKEPEAKDIYWLAVFPDKKTASSFADESSDKSMEEAQRKLRREVASFPGIRVFFTYQQMVDQVGMHFASYSASCLAVDGFYKSRGTKAPPWIREGFGAEVQRLTCKSVRCTTVSYEKGGGTAGENWPRDVQGILRKGGNTVLTATDAMRTGLEAIDMGYYQQMWSLFTYIRGLCGREDGARNRLRRIMEATAAGGESWKVVHEILAVKDPALTSTWHQWALIGGK